MKRTLPLGLLLIAGAIGAGRLAHADEIRLIAQNDQGELDGYYAQAEFHLSLLSDVTDRSSVAGTFGYALKAGRRWSSWGAFLQFEHNMWLSTELEKEVVQGAFNVGIGGEYLYAKGFVRTSLAAGVSILAFNTPLDDAGKVGMFLDLRPAGLRWPIHPRWVLALDPIAFALVAPVLDGVPLVQIEYRTVAYTEVLF